MRGTYRLKLLYRSLRSRWLRYQANQNISRFPIIGSRKPHDLSAPLIVTLTSYPPRYPQLAKTLKSLLDQSVAADRTVLWIAEKDMQALPDEVLALQDHGLDIRQTGDIRSYKKLIPALKTWPNANFVTADDDVYYPPDWLESLVSTAKEHPEKIVAGRVHIAPLDDQGNFVSYSSWQLASDLRIAPSKNVRLFPTGVGGVLYPPSAFEKTVFKARDFKRLAPQGDDIWFFWMARLAGTEHIRMDAWFDIIEWPDSQDVALYNDNLLGEGNDRQIKAMADHFGPVP